MKKFVVFGNPIKQSLSPVIHQDFATQANIQIEYTKRLSEPDIFLDDLHAFFKEANVLGCNVTAPFKEQAFAFADSAHDSASFAQAANTLHLVDGKVKAHNTDGAGLVNDLIRYGGNLSGARVLLLGAGGAARGVMQSLLNENIEHLTIANRTLQKANELLALTQNKNISAAALSSLEGDYDIVVNSTSASLVGDELDVGNLSFNNTALTYDMSYKARQTPFLSFAEQNGSQQNIDGLGMLVGQAAVAFTIWTGFEPDVSQLLNSLRQDMLA